MVHNVTLLWVGVSGPHKGIWTNKIRKEEIQVFVKNWEGSIPQSVAIATVKAS